MSRASKSDFNLVKRFFLKEDLLTQKIRDAEFTYYLEKEAELEEKIKETKNKIETASTTLKETQINIKGRHDPCIVPRAGPVAESVISIVLVDHILRAGLLPQVLGEKHGIRR